VVSGENADEEKLMDIVIDAGAEDIEVSDGVADIWGAPDAFESISKALEKAGIKPEEAELVRRPDNKMEIKEVNVANSVLKLIDDVQQVSSNLEIADEIADQVEA